uniref:Somatoliberin n=1 Tax=Scleropages formosus TaxID=113540 RepID=A0A8C9RXF4_SCLFO
AAISACITSTCCCCWIPELSAVMDKAAPLLLCCLVMSVSCSSLYPGVRFGQRASESPILISSSTRDPSQAPGTESSAPPRGQTKQRFGRHADAIFTNSYRKVLGQISARKFLQTIMGKRLGVGDARHYAKRQSDIFEDMFKQDLTTILREQKIKRWQLDVNRPR